MGRGGGGPNAQQAPRMTPYAPHAGGYMAAAQQPQVIRAHSQQQFTPYHPQRAALRMPMVRGPQPMSFQQPPPNVTGQQAPGPQQGQHQQNVHPTLMQQQSTPQLIFTNPPGMLPGVPQIMPGRPAVYYPALYQQPGVYQPQPFHGAHPSYNQPPPTIPNQPPQPRAPTPPSANTVQVSTAGVNPVTSGTHPMTIIQGGQGGYNHPQFPQHPPQAHPQQPQVTPQTSLPPTAAPTTYPSAVLPQQHQSKPYEKRKRNPLKITDPNSGQDVLASLGSSAVTSTTASTPNASVASEAKSSENEEMAETGSTPTASVAEDAASIEDSTKSSSPVPNEIPENKSVVEPQNTENRTVSVTNSVEATSDQTAEVKVASVTSKVVPEAAPVNNLETSTSKKIHSASSSNDGNDTEIHIDDSKSKQRNKKDAVKTTEVNNEKPEKAEKEASPALATSEAAAIKSTEADRQPSNTESISIESAQNDTVMQPSSNHVDSNHISEKHSEEEDIENDDQALTKTVENGNVSGASSTPASKSSSQIKLKYNYPDEQWSPLNTEGKKQYGRDFLMALSSDTLSMRKPENLPPMDIIKDSPNQPNRGIQAKDGLWTPGFVKGTSSKGPAMTKGGSRDRPSKPGRPGPPVILTLPEREIELKKAENAWKSKIKGAQEADPVEQLKREVRAILNRLTPQNFDRLVKKFNELEIDSEIKLKACIELIFEKAVDEPEFSVAYARMCEVLSSKKVTNENKNEQAKPMNFQRMMITRCQKEFERNYMENFDIEKFKADLAAAESEERKKEMQLEYEEEERRARRRSLGNIRFIGELYKLRMLTDRIMHEIIRKLLASSDEETLESLCWLLNTTGKQLEEATTQKLKQSTGDPNVTGIRPFDDYFNKIEVIAKNKDFPSRVRFLLQDVIDSRKNNWVPRRKKAGPKTIDEIHKEAESEKIQQQLMELKLPSGGGGGGQGGRRDNDNRGQGKRPSRGGQPQQSNDDSEWNTVPSSRTRNNERIDLAKIQNLANLNSARRDADNMTFGPGNRMGWGKGSGTAPKPPTNRYGGLQNFDAAPSANTDASPANRKYSASMGYTRRNDHERLQALENVRHMTNANGPTNNVMGPSPTPKDNFPQQQVAGGPSMSMDGHNLANFPVPHSKDEAELMAEQTKQLKGPRDLEDDKLKRKAKSILEEFVTNCDSESAYKDVCTDFHPSKMACVAEEIISQVLESKSKALNMAGQLLNHLVNKNVLLPQNMVEAVSKIIEFGSDMEIDIPKFWEYIGAIIAPLLNSGALSMSFLLETSQKGNLRAQGQDPTLVFKYLGHSLKALVSLEGVGQERVTELWKNSRLQLTQFMTHDDVPKFMNQYKLDFIDTQPESYIKSGLRNLMDDKDVKTDAVFSWIEDNVPEDDRTSNAFIRTLTRVVTESQIQINGGQMALNEDSYADSSNIIKRYLNGHINRELQALYALQQLMHELEHPNKLLAVIFLSLYNNDVISEEGFNAWLNSNDPAELEGKGVATKSTTHFFTWMKENVDENEEDD